MTRTPSLTLPPLSSDPYVLTVPTPTAPAMVYPIQFHSGLTTATYSVTGRTTADLTRSLNAHALPDPHEANSRYYARTEWYLSGQWSVVPTRRGCEVDHGLVSIAMTVTVPLLSPRVGVGSDVLDRWDRFLGNTVTHEKGHVELDLAGARDYQQQMGNWPPASSCAVLGQQMKDLFSLSFATVDQQNLDYDQKTKHGAQQGAVFP